MSAAVAVAGWAAGWALAGPVERLPEGFDPRPAVSIVIPCRNEAANLAPLLAALAAPGGRPIGSEVIVVNDGSADATARIATEGGALVLAVAKPEGWTGKTFACWSGAEAASGQVLVFLDADVRPAPGFVARLAADAQRSGGLVSVQPWHRPGSAPEMLSAAGNTVSAMAGTGGRRPSRQWWRRPVAFGAALAVPRPAYLRAGGHGRVRAEVAEDVAIAQELYGAGMPVAAYVDGGQGAVVVRMYPEGLGAVIDGWTKNLAAGASRQPPLRAALIGLWITGALHAACRGRRHPAGYAMYAAQCAVLFGRAGRFGMWPAAAYPVPLGAFTALFAVSAGRRICGRPGRWRGRPVAG